jgi:hypothetical protein
MSQLLIKVADAVPESVNPPIIHSVLSTIKEARTNGAIISEKLLNGAESRLQLLAHSNNPETIVKAFLNGQGNRESQIQSMKSVNGMVRNVWNRDFELLRGAENGTTKQIEMIRR